ncbi:MAG TPA: hypothetical protein VGX95_11245 [Xanthobacteraceae bacterium]|jgi:hypothetical protein|nr:hypothetical protein [Xanthobacteraceae bacterium]
MTDTTTAAEAARVAAETEASREIAAEAASDNPNPPDQTTEDAGQRTDRATADPSSKPAPAEAGVSPPSSEPKPLERITSADRSRADIAARFKDKRAAAGGQVEFHGDMRDPSQTYGPLGLAPEQRTEDGGQRTEEQLQPTQQQPTTEQAQTVQPAPPSSVLSPPSSESRLVKVKVHGREMFLPETEVIAEAQKSLAAGNLLESAKEVLAGARAQPAPAASTTETPAEPTGPNYAELAHELQLNPDAAAAGAKLKATIESETTKARQEAAREAARQVRIENELAGSQRALAAFEKAHPDLAADEFARDAVSTQVQREINADLANAVADGILKELPKTQDERNGLHTQLRAFGAPVRAIGDIFDAAGTKYASWRGGTPSSAPRATEGKSAPAFQPQTQPNAPAAPRVELTTARQERRANIVAQPTAGTVPPRAAVPSPELTTAQRRSAAVMAMRKARGQIVA